jgi:predicted nucleic acid-binding protein
VRGFLLDDNHVGAYFREEPRFMAKLRAIPVDWLMWVCSITLGEIEAGHQITQTTDQKKRDEFSEFVRKTFSIQEVSEYTKSYYGDIIGRIFRKHPPPTGKKTERHLVDLGVDINDVWVVAVAWEHGLIVLTNDKMACIKEAVDKDVQFEDWT